MYPVSNAFLTIFKANTRRYYWTGRITVKSGAVYDFGQDDIVKGSGYITSQCCVSTEIELGKKENPEKEDAILVALKHFRMI